MTLFGALSAKTRKSRLEGDGLRWILWFDFRSTTRSHQCQSRDVVETSLRCWTRDLNYSSVARNCYNQDRTSIGQPCFVDHCSRSSLLDVGWVIARKAEFGVVGGLSNRITLFLPLSWLLRFTTLVVLLIGWKIPQTQRRAREKAA